MDPLEYNRRAWDREVAKGNRWTQPVGPEVIAQARAGAWTIVLTPTRPVPASWFPPLVGAKVLGLACGGGQQGPILAAAGAEVTILDNSAAQLGQDRLVAEREGLRLRTEQGDMRDLARFADGTFDLIVHPVSNCFVDAVLPVWREAHRVLRQGGLLLAGFMNPASCLFDQADWDRGRLTVRHRIPYSDLESLPEPERRAMLLDKGEPLVWGHTLEDQLQGQLAAGFVLTGLYEDDWGGESPLDPFLKSFLATRARKP